MQGWRWLFALEGMPAVVLGMVAYFYLTDWPAEARWLPPERREWIVKALEAERNEVGRVSSWQALRSGRVQLLAAAAFTEYFVFYSFAFWFPTILKRWTGISDARIGWLGAIPYLVCLAAMVLNGWHSDRHHERRLHSAIPVLLGTIPLLARWSPRASAKLRRRRLWALSTRWAALRVLPGLTRSATWPVGPGAFRQD
jgi:sugar phosphate permease